MTDRRNNKEIIDVLKDVVTLAVDEAIDRKVPEVIKKVVNGKIDALTVKVDDLHIKIDPILDSIPELSDIGEGMKAFKFFAGGVKFIAAIFTGIGVIVAGVFYGAKFFIK